MRSSAPLNKVQGRIEEIATFFGNKSANLIVLDDFIRTIQSDVLEIEVPAFTPISSETIQKHLNTHAKEWRSLWKTFTEEQQENKTLTPSAIAQLDALRKCIINCFTEFPLAIKSIQELKLSPETLLTVRSTAEEDKIDIANPGGNKSVAAVKQDEKSISSAIGTVVASYFSEKSLAQRLLCGDDIRKTPFMPVLVQKMIGESLEGESKLEDIIVSGVIYSKKGEMVHIDAAPGHGELIVNSKGLFDTFHISDDGVVHPEIHRKETRLIPAETKDSSGALKRTLVYKSNPVSLQHAPALDSASAAEIAKIVHHIREHYGINVDIEFVYKKKNKDKKPILSIVQVRPIPECNKSITPSTLSPDCWARVQHKKINAEIVSPAGDATRIITHPEQLLISPNIREALRYYLKSPISQTKIRAVAIEIPSPRSSHEAALYNKRGIPVFQTNTQTLLSILKQPRPIIIMDPQRQAIVELTEIAKDFKQPEHDIIQNKMIINGLFFSSLSPRKTLLPIRSIHPEHKSIIKKYLSESDKKMAEPDKKVAEIELHDLIKETFQYFGSLLKHVLSLLEPPRSIITQDPPHQAIVDLSDTDFKKPEQEVPEKEKVIPGLFSSPLKSADEKTAVFDKKITEEERKVAVEDKEAVLIESKTKTNKPYSELLHLLEVIETSIPTEKNQEAFDALQKIADFFKKLATSRRSKEKNSPHQALFINAMISIAEIDHYLQSFTPDKSRIMLLQLVSKLKALIVNPGEEGLYSDSFKQIIQQNSLIHDYKIDELPIKPLERSYLIEFLKLNLLALKKETKEHWYQFALYCCQKRLACQLLAKLLKWSQEYHFQSDLINQIFVKKYQSLDEAKISSPSNLLVNIFEEVEAGILFIEKTCFAEISQCIQRWEKRIPEWATPNKFVLYDEFKNDINILLDKFSIDWSKIPVLPKKMLLGHVSNLVEIIDKTIKSLKGSAEYKDQKAHLENFYKLLVVYHAFMEKWMQLIPESAHVHNKKSIMIQTIREGFASLAKSKDYRQFEPSGVFDVSSARLDSPASFERQMIRQIKQLTLEDYFTLFHQNLLACMMHLNKNSLLEVESLPDELQQLLNKLQHGRLGAYLMSINHEHPKIGVHFNIPLSNHAAQLFLDFDIKNKKLEFYVKFYGHNDSNRMGNIVSAAIIEGALLNARILQAPRYSAESFSLEFSWEFDASSIGSLIRHVDRLLSSYIQMTFRRGPTLFAVIENYLKDSSIEAKAISEDIRNQIKEILISNKSAEDLLQWSVVYSHFIKVIFNPDDRAKLVFKHCFKNGFSFLDFFIEKYAFKPNNDFFNTLSLSTPLLKEGEASLLKAIVKKYEFKPDAMFFNQLFSSSSIKAIITILNILPPPPADFIPEHVLINFFIEPCLVELAIKKIDSFSREEISHYLYKEINNGEIEEKALLTFIEQYSSRIDFNYSKNKIVLLEVLLLMIIQKNYDFNIVEKLLQQQKDFVKTIKPIRFALYFQNSLALDKLLLMGFPIEKIDDNELRKNLTDEKGIERLRSVLICHPDLIENVISKLENLLKDRKIKHGMENDVTAFIHSLKQPGSPTLRISK